MRRLGQIAAVMVAIAGGCSAVAEFAGSDSDAVGAGMSDLGQENEPWWCPVHRSRNRYQEGLCPASRPEVGYQDPATGVVFGPQEWWDFFHWPEVCQRGKGGVLEAIEYDPQTLAMFETLGVDPDELTPCAQCCYDSVTDELTDSGSFDFQCPPMPLDFLLSPSTAGAELSLHLLLDVDPYLSVCAPE